MQPPAIQKFQASTVATNLIDPPEKSHTPAVGLALLSQRPCRSTAATEPGLGTSHEAVLSFVAAVAELTNHTSTDVWTAARTNGLPAASNPMRSMKAPGR